MTVTDQMWARGASAPVTLPSAPAPPAPPTYFPPTTEGGRPGRGPRRRFPRWIVGTLVLVAVAAAGVGGGWALRGANTPDPAVASPSAAPTSETPTLTADEAKKQTCEAYDTIGTQWTAAYRTWLAALPPNWTWDDPAVKTVTATFDGVATQAAAQLSSLVAPSTPAEVSTAVQDVRSAIVSLAASHGKTAGSETTAKIDETMAKVDQANRVCGL